MNDLLPFATTLATIVGLICNFKQERGANASASRQEFMDYLNDHRHQEIKDLIANTHELSREVDNLLREEHAVIIAKLNTVNSVLATIISRIDGLAGLARVLAPRVELSNQALNILCAFLKSGSSEMEVMYAHGKPFLMFNNAGQFSPDDQQFFDDDLNVLCDLCLLARDFSPKGTPKYRPTRAGASYAATAKSKTHEPSAVRR